ncbi:MAG: phage scaffolding protein [Lachnospiraceae bacterium]|nr:phage scaffolding protein [Lachnospiraceae bacterium]
MDIFEMLKEAGVEIPADKKDAFNKEFRKTYKSEGEIKKATEKIEQERDDWMQKAETAEETLKKFEGIDPAEIQKELETYKQKAADAERDYAEKIAQRDFDDALKSEMENYKFTSEAAKKAIMAEIREAGLKLKDGKILGLSDLLGKMKEKDASAFVDEQLQQLEKGKAKPFTQSLTPKPAPGTKVTPAELMKMKNENPDLDISQYM